MLQQVARLEHEYQKSQNALGRALHYYNLAKDAADQAITPLVPELRDKLDGLQTKIQTIHRAGELLRALHLRVQARIIEHDAYQPYDTERTGAQDEPPIEIPDSLPPEATDW